MDSAHVLYTQLMHCVWVKCQITHTKSCIQTVDLKGAFPGIRECSSIWERPELRYFLSLSVFFVLVPTCFASHISPGAICLICAHSYSYGVVYLLWLINTKLHTNMYPHIILNRFWMEVFQLLPLNNHTVFIFNTYTPWQWDVRYNTFVHTPTYTSWNWKHIHTYIHTYNRQYYIHTNAIHSMYSSSDETA